MRGQRQQGRIEWGHRLDRAIDLLMSPNRMAHDIGWELLGDVIESDLGSDADRYLARRVSQISPDAEVDLRGEPDDNGAGQEM